MSTDSTILGLTIITPKPALVIPAADPTATSGLQNVGITVAALQELIPAGAAGSQIYALSATPSSSFGNNGDYYLLGGQLFGPKTGGQWPTTALVLTSAADAANAAAIAAEVTRATAAEGTLGANVTSVSNQLTGITSSFNSALAAETLSRQAGDTTNANAISAEATRAEAAEGVLTSSVTALTANLASEVTARGAAITSEANTRASADTANAAAISAETARAQAAEAALTSSIATAATNLTTETSNRQSAITSEAATRASADTANASAIAAEATRAEGAEAALSSSITGVANNLATETSNRQSAISSEATARQAADTNNANAISAETARAEAAEAALTTSIATNTSNMAAETSNRIAAIASEAATRSTADTANSNAISAETTRALAAEALLAPRFSPGLQGIPTAPTANPLTNNGQLATTQYSDAAVAVEASARAALTLAKANNLSDVASPSAARSNLGLSAIAVLAVGLGLISSGGALAANFGTTTGTVADGGVLASVQATANAAIPSSAIGTTVAPLSGGTIPLSYMSPGILGAPHYVGTWNAATNLPALSSGTSPGGAQPTGSYYIVGTAGGTALNGISTWNVGDWVLWSGAAWEKLDGQANPVSAVAGYQGSVTAGQLASALALTAPATAPFGTSAGTVADGGATTAALAAKQATLAAGTAGQFYTASGTAGMPLLLSANVANGPLLLDGYGHVSGQTMGPNASVAPTFVALTQIPSISGGTGLLINQQTVTLTNYSVIGDQCGGIFQWNSASTAAPDLGVTVCPLDRQTVVSLASLGTGNGTATTFSGTLAHTNLIPGSITIAAGAATATDNGAGILYISGAQVGTVNNGTGAYSLTFPVAPANGVSIQATYSYASMQGRWVRQFVGPYTPMFYGALPSVDFSPQVLAANNAAYSTNGAVYIPTAPNGAWTLNHQVVFTCSKIYGDAGSFDTGTGTWINWTPSALTDQVSAFKFSGTGSCEDIFIKGADGRPTQAQLISGGYILTQAAFTANFSGNTMTVTAVSSGTILFSSTQYNNSISGQNMAAQALGTVQVLSQTSGTPGGVGVYTIGGASQGTLTGISVTQTLLPQYAALKAGSAAFEGNAEFYFLRCASVNVKIGLLITSPVGHVSADMCTFQGILGTYCTYNDGDYKFWNCDFAGSVFACVAANGNGIDIRTYAGHIGFCSYGYFQFATNTVTSAGTFSSFGTSFEAVGEAIIQTLPSQANFGLWIYGSQYGNINSTYALPNSLVPSAGQYLFQFLGGIGVLKCPSPNGGNGTFGGGNSGYTAYFGGAAPASNGDFDIDAFEGSVVFGSAGFPTINRDLRMPRWERDFIRRSEVARQKQLLPSGNLFLNPEVAGNWVLASGSPTISVTRLQTLLSGALAGQVIPRNLYEECGTNPQVICITGASAGAIVELPVVSGITWESNRSINFRCWGLASSGHALVRLQNTNILASNNFFNASAFSVASYLGSTLADDSDTAVSIALIQLSAAGTLYLIGPTLSFDDWVPYNPLAIAYATTGLAIGNSALASASAPTLTADVGGDLVITATSGASVVQNCGTVDASTQTSAPITGATVNIPSGCATYFINPAGTLAALTVALPSAPTTVAGSSFELDVCFTQAITALTVNPGSGTTVSGATLPSGVSAGAMIKFRYAQSLNKWVHVVPV